MSNRIRRVTMLTLLALLGACQGLLVEKEYQYGQLEVRAELRSGAGVPGMLVRVYSGTRIHATALTSADGTARFSFLPEGILGVEAIAPTGFRHQDPVRGFVRSLRLQEGARDTLRFPLFQTSPGDLRVEVRDSAGSALDSVRVELYSPAGLVRRYTTGVELPALHTFSALPFGEYGVRVIAGRGYRLPPSGYSKDGLQVDGSVTELAALRLAPCRGRVGGTVEWWNGQPVTGATVVLYDGEGERLRGITGVDGRMEAKGAACGDYGVFVAALPRDAVPIPPGEEVRDGLRLLQHDLTVGATFRINRCASVLRVTVRDQFGGAVAGAPIELYSAQGIVGRDSTDARGVAAPRVSPTPCQPVGARVAPFRYYLTEPATDTTYVDGLVPRNETTLPVSLRLRRCRGQITSSVRRRDGRPVSGATLVIYTGRGELRRGTTGSDGTLVVDDLLCGDYGVAVAALPDGTLPMAAGTTWRDGLRFTADGRALQADFTADQCLGSYRVTVRDQLGAPVAAAPVELYDGTGGFLTRVTDASGLAVIDVPPRPCRALGIRVAPAPGTTIEPGPGTHYVDGLEPRNDAVASLSLRLRRLP